MINLQACSAVVEGMCLPECSSGCQNFCFPMPAHLGHFESYVAHMTLCSCMQLESCPLKTPSLTSFCDFFPNRLCDGSVCLSAHLGISLITVRGF